MEETDNIYPGVDKNSFTIKLSTPFEKGDLLSSSVVVKDKPKLTKWSKIKKFFGLKNLTYLTEVQLIEK